MVDGHHEAAEEGIDAPAAERVIVRHGRSPLFWISLIVLGVLTAVLIGAWTARRPIAEHFVEQELARRGVRATYQLESIGLHNQIIRDVTIGDPASPDLTARYAKIQMRIQWNGAVEVYRIAARGVRLRGELRRDGKVSWGEIDKLLPPPSGKPFRLPDIAVHLADTTIALKTPYGNLGFALAGAGNLTGGFKGRLAVAGPALVTGACRLNGLRGNVALGVEARRPNINGPIAADRFVCPKSRMAMVAPRLELASGFSEAFERFDGTGRLSVASFAAGDNGLANLNALIGFAGSPSDAGGTIKLSAQRGRLGSIFADATRLEGKYRLWTGRGELALSADYAADSATLAPAMVAPLVAPLESAKGTPIGPIGQAIAAAVRRTAGNFNATGHLRLVNLRGGGGVRIETADARGANGARVIVSGGDGVTYYWPDARLRVDGNISTGGGGLPRADIALRQPRQGGPMSGEARIAPYSAVGARLALAPVTFRAARDGSTAINTIALLDGPFSGGFVRGLRIPISGAIGGPGGGFAFGRGCIDARFQSLTAGSLRLGAARVPLCATGRALVFKNGQGPVQIGGVTRNLRLGGQLGKSPFQLAAAQARLTGSDRFAATGLGLQLGRPNSPVKITATSLDGRLVKGGATGKFGGATALIGRVPVRLSDASGAFDFRGGALAVNGSSTVSDLAPLPRFYPLASNDLQFRLANDLIRTTGSLRHPASGTKVTDIMITHRLSTGTGEALLDVPGIRFGNAVQPDQLTRLAEGVIALVNGTVTGQGRVNWRGDGQVTSTGEFTTDGTDLAASFGPVTGLKGTIRFTNLLGLETAPGQTLSVGSINPGILVENGEIKYQILPGQLVKIERGDWPFMGGRLILQETIINLARSSPKRLTFEVVGLDANEFVGRLGFKDLQATGIFDGVLPMIFDDNGGRIVGGRLDSRAGGGTLAYEGAINRANLGFFGGLAFDALRSLRFRNMIVRLDGDLAGEFATRLTIDQVAIGQSNSIQRILRSAVRSVPFKFNVTIIGPFRSLIATAKSMQDPRGVIRDVLPVPLDQIPGVVTEVRRREQSQTMQQTPVDQKIEVTTTSPSKSE
ncbi:MAG: YdbH domain-containing protein [Sphingomonas bacterium]|nr:YdbH domain-containing protein [Sphingomonas bacterium]